MKNTLKVYVFIFFVQLCTPAFSQNEAKRWHFGNYAALNFNSNPPTIVTTSTMNTAYSCASIADAAGNLLFYTNGSTVWDQTNAIMANGTGLLGNGGGGGSQNVIIIKKPASSSIYYVFTSQWNGLNTTNGLYYSEVDMTLASGNGSVTVKNTPVCVSTASLTTGKLTATRHCNGNDIWLVARDWYYNNTVFTGTITTNNSFRSFLITASGVNTTAVISTPSTYTYTGNFGWFFDYGGMKVSPNGKQLGLALYGNNNFNNNNNGNAFELYDYDNTTGIVSNSLALLTNTVNNFNNNYSWGCEFSPDGTKFYGSKLNNNIYGSLFQWDLCAGSPTAIVASMYTVVPANNLNFQNFGALQLAPNGKIYVARANNLQSLDVINNPNALGAACGYSASAQSTSPRNSNYSLPNFMGSYFISHPPPTPFTSTVSPVYGCQTASFNSIYTPSVPLVGCASAGYSLIGLLWNFGDPASGSANTSTLSNPSHAYTSLGTYTAQLVLYYSCGGGTDTIRQPVNVNIPCISVTSTSITCSNLGSATVTSLGGVGPFSYTWMPSAQTSSVATGLSPGTYVLTVHDFGNNFTYTASTVFTSLIPLSGNLNNSASIPCNGIPTGTANITGIAGGSGSQTYAWSNGVVTYTPPSPNNLSAGLWSVTVTDALTGCQVNKQFLITQPPALSLNLSSATPTSCAGTSVALTGTASGGSPIIPPPGYTYSWTAGTSTDTYAASQNVPGNYVYTLTAQDNNSCTISNTIGLTFVNNPTLSVSNVSICPLQNGTLTVSGATTYTWSNNSTGNTFTDNPLSNQQYTVIGGALSCTSSAVASIILKPVPVPTLSSNSPVCNNQSLLFYGSGGASYAWNGPQGFISGVQNPTINPAIPANSGVYNATVTAANSCTAAQSTTVTVNPTPTIIVSGDTVCVTQTIHITAVSFPGASYAWTGPNSFTSNLQNPSITNPSTSASGHYTVLVTSVAGCTNTSVTSASAVALPVPSYATNSPRCFGTTLNLNAGGTTGANGYAWIGPNGFSSNLQSTTIPNVTLPAGGIYTLVVTIGPCVVSYTAPAVIINPLPVLTATNNGPVCDGKNLHIWANGSGTTYTWMGPAPFIPVHLPDIYYSPATFSNAGTYTVTVTDVNGCSSFSTTAVTINANPVVHATGATVCMNETSTLTASGAVSYLWYGPSNYVSIFQPAVIPVTSPAFVGTYTVIGTALNSCTSTATADVFIQPLPQPSVIATNTTCINGVISLQGFGGRKYAWAGPANFFSASPSVTFAAFSKAMSGTYSLTVTDSIGCKAQITTPITVYDPPGGGLWSEVNKRCVPFCSDFKIIPNTASHIDSTMWLIGNKQFFGNQFRYCFTDAGRYVINGTFMDAHCTGTSSFVVDAYAVPVADFSYSPDKPIEDVDPVIFTNTSTGDQLSKFRWSVKDNDGIDVSTYEHASHLFSQAGVYPVAMVVTNTLGCSDTIVKLVTIQTGFNIFVPNAFTPNDDNKNELFMPVTRGIKYITFEVFDRWGTKIYSTKDITGGWDGSYNGQPCKQDIYVWKATATSINGDTKNLVGNVTLLR